MAKPMLKPKLRTPGVEPQAPAGGESNPDEAIALAAQGQARKIAKPRIAVPPSKVAGDPQRPADAPVNSKRETSYEEAMKMLGAEDETKDLQAERVRLREDLATLGDEPDEKERRAEIQVRMGEIRGRIAELSKVPKLTRPVLTEQGWVTPRKIPMPAGAKV